MNSMINKRLRQWLLPCTMVFSLLAPLPAAAQTRQSLPDFADLAEKQGAAVVNISTTQIVRQNRVMPGIPFDESDPMFELFRRFFPQQPRQGQAPREYQNHSLGSGFIISADGYVMTNAHVVDGADEVTVKLNDKREFRATIVGADKRTDVALLKIEARDLPTVKLGDPARLRVGEWVVAIGSPFGFDNSVTAGIVSAKGRSLPDETYVPFIQTDVAINPGNSGGPLFNLQGEVVGVNSQIYSRTGGYMGLAFAIPIDVAMDIQQQLRAHGKVSRGRIGVSIQEVSKELAESFGLSKATGVLISAVEPGSPAEKGGLESGDVILKFDGKTISAASDLPRLVGNTRPGAKVAVEVWRRGASRTLSLVVGEMKEEKVAQRNSKRSGKPTEPAAANRLGLVLSELSPEQRRELKINGGVLVEDIRNATGRNDLRPGDIILAATIKGVLTEVASVEQFAKLLTPVEKGGMVTLLIRRGENQTFISLKVPADAK